MVLGDQRSLAYSRQMGHISHTSIVITAEAKHMDEILQLVQSSGLPFIGPSESQLNSFQTLCVVSRGSKFGWPDAVAHTTKCDELCARLSKTQAEWVRIRYGHDDQCLPIVADSFEGRDPRPCLDLEDLSEWRQRS
jgi:hypothetical protein